MIQLLAALALLLAPLPAATYHVDPSDGSDSADGLTPATAWKSSTPLAGRPLQAGDLLLFKAGTTQHGSFQLEARGKPGRPVGIGRYGDGPAPILHGMGASSTLTLSNPDHLVIQDLEITNPADSITARNGLVLMANDGTDAENITLRRLHIHHVSGHDDRGGGCGLLVGAGKSPERQASRYVGLIIEDCLFHDLPFNGIMVSGWENRDRDGRGELTHPSTGVIVRRNLLHDIAGDAICLIYCKDAIIEHNEVYRSSIGQVRGNPEAASVAIWPHSSDGTIMRRNRVEGLRGGKDGQAFDVDIDCRDTLIEYNFTRDNGTGFLLVCSGEDNSRTPETRGVIVRYNLCVDECAEPPGALFTFVSNVRDIVIENNAFLFSQPGERRLLHAGNWLGPDWPRDILFQRNLILSAGSLISEPHDTRKLDWSGNLWLGELEFHPRDTKGEKADPAILDRLTESFAATLRQDPSIRAIGFKPFDPFTAGLPADSPLREKATAARKMGPAR